MLNHVANASRLKDRDKNVLRRFWRLTSIGSLSKVCAEEVKDMITKYIKCWSSLRDKRIDTDSMWDNSSFCLISLPRGDTRPDPD